MHSHLIDTKHGKLGVDLFDTPAEFLEAAKKDNGQPFNGWTGGGTKDGFFRKFETGDNSQVARSNKILERLEGKFHFRSSGFRTIDAVSGGAPVVPNVVANLPVTMRRRQRVVDELRPLSIVLDLTSSAAIDADDLVARGVALLALIRLLAARRPITLWIGAGLNNSHRDRKGSMVLFKMDTSPLDLARAALMVSHPGVPRYLAYGYVTSRHNCGGGWPLNSIEKIRTIGSECWNEVFGTEVLFIPPIYRDDEYTAAKMDGWLEKMLAQYGGIEQE